MWTIWRRLQISAVWYKRLWSCNRVPSFKLIDDQNPLGLLPLVKSVNLKEDTLGTFSQISVLSGQVSALQRDGLTEPDTFRRPSRQTVSYL
jgi:hypothetical protein